MYGERTSPFIDSSTILLYSYYVFTYARVNSFSIKTYGLFKLVKEYKINIKKTTNRTEFAKAFPKVNLLKKVGANTYNYY